MSNADNTTLRGSNGADSDTTDAGDSSISLRFVPIASPSPLDTPTVSGEDDDYRSETSSETTASRYSRRSSSSYSTAADTHTNKRCRQQSATAYSNHRDLSQRLKRAVHNASDSCYFDASLIGADVVFCVADSTSCFDDNDTSPVASSAVPATIKRFYAHRFMLAASSDAFRVMLTGRMREATERDVALHDIEPHVFEKMLLFIYTGDVVLDLDNVVGLLVAAEMYELTALREICKSFVLYHAHDVFKTPQIVELPEKLLLEIVQNDELQIREVPLLEAVVHWGKAHVVNAEKPLIDVLADVMEHVRFGTMSVSELHGKVRVLVRDNVVRESLLTEALFHHLKYGTPSGRASQRMKPRALAAALRKRKRVSFIQHVSFHE